MEHRNDLVVVFIDPFARSCPPRTVTLFVVFVVLLILVQGGGVPHSVRALLPGLSPPLSEDEESADDDEQDHVHHAHKDVHHRC